MIYYQSTAQKFKGKFDEKGNMIEKPTLEDKIKGYGLTGGYVCVVIVFGFMYKKLAAYQTIKENWRYQKQYEDALINRLFIFNCINFYMPMLLVAFMVKSYDNLFMMMATQMAVK
jgi:hypothetical protein